MCLLDKGLSWGSSRGLATPRVDLSGCRLGVISEQSAATPTTSSPPPLHPSASLLSSPFVSLDQVYVLSLLVPAPRQDGFKLDQHGPCWPGCTLRIAPWGQESTALASEPRRRSGLRRRPHNTGGSCDVLRASPQAAVGKVLASPLVPGVPGCQKRRLGYDWWRSEAADADVSPGSQLVSFTDPSGLRYRGGSIKPTGSRPGSPKLLAPRCDSGHKNFS